MPASPDLFRSLGALCEPPEPAHGRLAAALGLPAPPDAATFTEVFAFQLVPYGAPYLSHDGMLGGEPGDRVAGFWRALHLTPPAEPDHLAALLGLYAALSERETAAARPEALRAARRALLWEHVLSWVPLYADAMSALPSPFHRAWARLLRRALLAEARPLRPPPRSLLHVRDVPALPDPGSKDFVRALLAPVRSGLLITRSDLAAAAVSTGLGARAGGRAFMLHALLEQDPDATVRWLAGRADWWVRRHQASVPALGPIARHWLGRAEASLRALQPAPSLADAVTRGPQIRNARNVLPGGPGEPLR
jgi:nitrate reductase delta subunit